MPEKLYSSYSVEYSTQDIDGILGTATYTFWSDKPDSKLKIGDKITGDKFLPKEIVPNPIIRSQDKSGNFKFTQLPDFVITGIKVNDEVIGEAYGLPYRQWQVTYEGYLTADTGEQAAKITGYSVTVEEDEDEEKINYAATIEAVNSGETPIIIFSIGEQIQIPSLTNSLKCKSYSFSDSVNNLGLHIWTVTYEAEGKAISGSSSEDFELPAEETTDITHELNGLTVRTIAGELIALRRSQTPITRKTVIAYSETEAPVYELGSECNGGIVLSDKVVKETKEITKTVDSSEEIETVTYYRHEIEVEV